MRTDVLKIVGPQAFPDVMAAAPSLSAELRARTAPLHARAERLLGLPGAIRSPHDYLPWLQRFLGLYEPLERSLAAFSEWDSIGLPVASRWHTGWLVGDITALGADPLAAPRTPPDQLPDLPTFAHALGAFYVLEGATLGGRVILRHLETRIGGPIEEAKGFLGGRGDAAGPMWQSFQAALDGFGRERPQLREDVAIGAERAFGAILAWFTPFRAGAVNRP
jgi:heme oxygenase (biliverdin-IX-beta and delta-forming)